MGEAKGYTDELKEICADECARFGDPPCWQLPDLIWPCDDMTPCESCIQKAKARSLPHVPIDWMDKK